MKLPTEDYTYNEVCNRLEKQEPFTFTRFGDGEWNAIFGKQGVNGDKHRYFRNMGRQLRHIVRKNRGDNYIFSLQPLSNRMMGKRIGRLVNKNIYWYNSDCFARASIRDNIDRYFNALRTNRLIMVGPKYLKAFKGYDEFVSVLSSNCWLRKDKIIDDIKSKLSNEHTVVSVTASMAANVIVDELYKIYGDVHTFIDAGSVYDPYVGVKTRGYHNKILKRLSNN